MLKIIRDLVKNTGFLPLAIVLLFSTVPAQESEACLDCHDTKAAGLVNTTHELAKAPQLSSPIKISCQSCHDGWENHIEDPSPDNIVAGNEVTLLKQAEICGRCHITPHQTAMVSTDPHRNYDIKCSSCHTLHDNHNNKLVKDDRENFCLSCHGSVAFEFKQRSFHPLESGNIKCTDCHNLSSIASTDNAIGFDWRCQSCHDDLSGPFLYEHPVVYAHLVEGQSCMECHAPHGSANDRLLKQPGNGTCNQCHGTPPGHLTNHSGLGAKLDCVQCHSEIHGSFANRLFLDPDLGVKLFPDCYQSGCHIIND